MARLFAVLFVFMTLGAAAAPVASLASLEGEVSVLRSGVLIPSEKISEGFLLEAFDTVSTGTTGRADIRPAATGITGSFRLDAATSLYLDWTSLKKEQPVGIELLTGGLSVRVSAAAGASVVEVRTAAGTFYGPGPAFRVVGTSGGDFLVTSSAGKVVCQVPERTVFIEPGSVVQTLFLDQTVQTIPMNVSTLEAFEAAWLAQRRQVFKDQAAVYFRTAASRYQLQGAQFQRAWDRYQRELKDDERGLRAATANLRRAATPLERTLFQIRALKALLDAGGLSPSLELGRGYAAKDFFRQAALEDTLWSARLGESRGFYRIWADRSGGEFPVVSDGDPITWDTDYFH